MADAVKHCAGGLFRQLAPFFVKLFELGGDFGLAGAEREALFGIGGDGAYYAMEYTSRLGGKPEKKWLVCMDPKNPDKSCVLSGMPSKEEAIAIVKSVEPNAVFKEAA